MRTISVSSAALLLAAVPALAGGESGAPAPIARLERIEVPFVANRGQFPGAVAFAAPALFGTVFVRTDGRLVYRGVGARARKQPSAEPGSSAPSGWTLTEEFVGGRARPAAGAPSAARVSEFRGGDPARWESNVPTFEEVSLGEVWPSVSVRLRARGREVEKVFTLQPGAPADRIRLRVRGGGRLTVEPDGSLAAHLPGEGVRFAPPVAYQEAEGRRLPVDVEYVARGAQYGFRLGPHDRKLAVTIDPVLQSTYVGGAQADAAEAIAIEPGSGEVVVAGYTYSTDFPGIARNDHLERPRGVEAFVARFDAALTTLLQATYFGGSGGEEALGIAVHPATGEVFVAGFTSSSDFPSTALGAQPKSGGSTDGFVARFDRTLSHLVRATYFGGSHLDEIVGVTVHPRSGEIVVAGTTYSPDLPFTAGGAQPAGSGDEDGFLARFDPTLARVLQATYFGGPGPDLLRALAIHPGNGEILVGGQTLSYTGFPAIDGGANASPPGGNGNFDAFLARLDPTLTRDLQSTYLGSSGAEDVLGIAVHPATGDIYATGWTDNGDFPATAGGAQPAIAWERDCYVARFNSSLTALAQSTYFGGEGDDFCNGIVIHPSRGDVYVAGETYSKDLPGPRGAQASYEGLEDGFLARFDPTLTRIIRTTYIGGSDTDVASALAVEPSTGDVLVAGGTSSPDLPETSAGAKPAYAGGSGFGGDGFVSRLQAGLGDGGGCLSSPDSLCLNGGRFQVRVAWRVPAQSSSGVGHAVSLTKDTGYFWFFNSANVELVLKVLDARALDGHFWVFYGALSNVEYTITVTDTQTGRVRTYFNSDGTLASVADTAAFDDTATGAEGITAGPAPGPGGSAASARATELFAEFASSVRSSAPEGASAAPCVPGTATLCLGSARFRVEVDWTVPAHGTSGRGAAVPLTGDTGYFWFFNSANVELVLKVLDGRTVNGHFWVFYGALTNVEYTIRVTDLQTGAVRTYSNPDGNMASVADTSAF